MLNLMKCFLLAEEGQDMVEYTLLLAFVALGSATLFISVGRSVTGIWSTVNNRLAAANSKGS